MVTKKKMVWLLLLLFLTAGKMSTVHAQNNAEPNHGIIDRSVAQYIAIAKHDEEVLQKISSDLLAIFVSFEDGQAMKWFLQNMIYQIDEIAKLLEHEALLVEIGLNYVKGNEKLIFYKNVFQNRLEQYKKEITASFDSINNTQYVITDNSALLLITQAKETIGQTIESHTRCIEVLKSLAEHL